MKFCRRCFLFYITFATIIVSACAEEEESVPSSMESYINRRLREIKVGIAKSNSADPPLAADRVYDVRWQPLWKKDVNSNNALALSYSNETFVLADERVLHVELDVSDKVTLDQVALIEDQKSAKFVRTLFWNASLHFLICRDDGSCTLHVGSNTNDLRYSQIINRPGMIMDAEFFTQFDQLYLVFAHNSGQFSVSSVIYRWTGTYMDIISEISTTGAVSVTTFNHKHSTIIIFAQNVEERPNIGTEIFRFKDGSVEKIQFLDTDGPIFVQHYEYDNKTFLLVINEINESQVFWWDGKEFLDWMKLPKMSAPRKVNIVYVNGDTLLLVAQQNTLSLYRILNLAYTKLNLLELTDGKVIMDFNARVRGSSIILVLVTKSKDNLCHVEPKELTIRKYEKEDPPEITDDTWQILMQLDHLLKERMPAIQKAYEFWPNLLPSSGNVVISSPLEIEDLVMESGSVGDLVVSSSEEILTPTELMGELQELSLSADSLISKSDEFLYPNVPAEITGTLVVQGDAFIDELYLDSLNVSSLNNNKVEFDGVLSYTKDQDFDDPLGGDTVTIQNLNVDSLCGIPFENWQMTTDDEKTGLDILAGNVKILNNTILVQSDLSVDNLGVINLNNLHLESFVDDLFIIGINQKINGSIYFRKGLNAYNVTINSTNGIDANQLLTKTTDQILGDVLIRTLEIDDIHVEKINNVSVKNAARISQENVISGQVTFHHLRITEELMADGVAVHFDVRPVQLYSTVQIDGNVFIKNLELNSATSIDLNGLKVDLNSLFNDHWTKSTDQNIIHNVTLTGGITIDDLYATYLNGYKDEDFLLSTVEEIPEKFGPLHFERFEIDGYLLADGGGQLPIESIVKDDGTLIVNQKLQIAGIKLINLKADTYNKIPVEEIAAGKTGVNISGTIKYENLIVREDLTVDELLVKFLNDRNLTNFFEEALVVDENLEIDYLELPSLQTDDFEVEVLSGLRMADFERMLVYKDITAVKNITVDGDLLITGNLKVDFINNLPASDFVERLSNDDIELTGIQKLDKFVVYNNLSAASLCDIKIEDLVSNTLSKTKSQRITGPYRFYKVQTDSLKAIEINGLNVTQPKLVTDPLFFNGDVAFTMLLVQGDIATGRFNGQDISELYENALNVPLTRISNLTITGKLSWENPSPNAGNSISHLLSNAVTKESNQTITGEVTFADDVCVYRLICGTENIGGVDISAIVLDAVIPNGQPIEITGQKILTKGLTVRKLEVSGDIEIRNVSGLDIVELNSTIVGKFEDQTITANTIFKNHVTIENLEVVGTVHGIKSRDIADTNSSLPSNTRFENLHIQNQLYANKLDGIDFDEFIKNRVTINGNHDIYSNVVFQDPVVVNHNAVLSSINGIGISEIALSGSNTSQIISSEKTILNDLIVHGNVFADLINDIDVTEEYENGIFNNRDIRIDGNLIFSADFETDSNVSVSGLINGINLKGFSEDLSRADLTTIRDFARNQYAVEKMIDRSLNYSKNLPDLFFYFDEQPDLVIRVPNIRKVETVMVESMTKLNLYGVEKGSNCQLADFCKCRTQYVAELLEDECKVWKLNGSKITYNIHDSGNRYGVNVVTNSVSSEPICTKEDHRASEFSTISWIIPKRLPTGEIVGEITNNSLKISGYLSDVKTFTIGENLYVVLAIYYDAMIKSHRVNSLVYKIDLTNNRMELSQEIGTSGAVALDVFATQLHGMHLIIACEKDPAESQLHRFNMFKSEFELLRSFRTGGSTNVRSVIQGEESFVILDDPLANTVHIFNYNKEFDNYHFYQSLYHSSVVKDIQVFYSGEFGISDAFLIVTTDEGRFFVYEYMYFGGFQLRSQEWLDGVQTMVPFQFSQRRYVFAGTNTNSTVYRIVEQGPNYF